MKRKKTGKIKTKINARKILQALVLTVFLIEIFSIGNAIYRKMEKPTIAKEQKGQFYGYSGRADISQGVALSACAESSPTSASVPAGSAALSSAGLSASTPTDPVSPVGSGSASSAPPVDSLAGNSCECSLVFGGGDPCTGGYCDGCRCVYSGGCKSNCACAMDVSVGATCPDGCGGYCNGQKTGGGTTGSGDIQPLPASSYRSLWQFQFAYQSSGEKNILGYKNVNSPYSRQPDNRGEAMLYSDNIFNCVGGNAEVNNVGNCAYSSQDMQMFKVYFPPGSKTQTVSFYKSQDSGSSGIVLMRLNEPPQGTYNQATIKNGASEYYRSGAGSFAKTSGKDHIMLLSSSGVNNLFQDSAPENFSGGWLYVRIIPVSSTMHYIGYNGYVDYAKYKTWYDSMTTNNSWQTDGDPAGSTATTILNPGIACAQAIPICSAGSDAVATGVDNAGCTIYTCQAILPTGPDCAQKVCSGNSCHNGTTWIPGAKTTDCSGGEAKATPNSVTPIKEWTTEQRAEEISYLTWTTNSQTKQLEVECTGPAPIARANMQLTSALWQTQAAKDGSYLKQPNEPDGYPGWFHVGTSGTEVCTFYPTNISDGLPGTPFSTKVEVKASGGVACDEKIDLDITILVLDDISVNDKVEADFRKAVSFVEGNSKFKLNYTIVQSNLPHSYTKYDCPEGKQTCVVVNKEDINQEVIQSLPISTFYFFFWKANGAPVLQAGSTWGVSNGILKDGVQRPYSTVAVDPWWYNREPFEGFEYRSSQLISHELINLIQALTEVAPYNCAPLTADNTGLAYTNEISRLEKMTDECYQKIATANGGNTLCADGAQETCQSSPTASFCPGGITEVIATGTDANGCSIYGCRSEQALSDACQPDDPSCAKSTCNDVSCFDGCNYLRGLKDCVGRR